MPVWECGLLREFALTHAAELENGVAMELELATPMPIQVGDDNINYGWKPRQVCRTAGQGAF